MSRTVFFGYIKFFCNGYKTVADYRYATFKIRWLYLVYYDYHLLVFAFRITFWCRGRRPRRPAEKNLRKFLQLSNLRDVEDAVPYTNNFYIALLLISSKRTFIKSSTATAPSSPFLRDRTETVPLWISLSPIISIYGTLSV